MYNSTQAYEENGSIKVSQFIDETTINTVSRYLENKIKRKEWVVEGIWDQSKYGYYADPLLEVMLERCRDEVGRLVGKDLLSTYSYVRVYQPGEQLEPHVDRPSCETSVTVSVAKKGEDSPIMVQYANRDPARYILKDGDAVIYKGCEATHWRAPLKRDQLIVQFMLHYVDKNGPNAEYAMDKRVCIGAPVNEE